MNPMTHDAVHFFTLFMMILIPCAMLAGICTIIVQGRRAWRDARGTDRKEKLKRQFRRSYRDWKTLEKAGDFSAYIERQNAEEFHHALKAMGV